MHVSRADSRALLTSLVLALALISGLPPLVLGQTTPGEPPGLVYFSESPTHHDPFINVAPFTPFTLYLVADIDYADLGRADLNASVGIQAWEAGAVIPGLGEDFLITSATIRNESVNVGNNTCILDPVAQESWTEIKARY